jgi:hypothetical protein
MQERRVCGNYLFEGDVYAGEAVLFPGGVESVP